MQTASSQYAAWKSNRREALRELAEARRRQLELALQGRVVASAACADRAKAIARRLTGCCPAEARAVIPA